MKGFVVLVFVFVVVVVVVDYCFFDCFKFSSTSFNLCLFSGCDFQ